MRILFILLAALCFYSKASAGTLTFRDATSYGVMNSPYGSELARNRLQNFGIEIDDSKLINPDLEYEYNEREKKNEFIFTQPFRMSDLTFERSSYERTMEELNAYEKRLDILHLYHNITESYLDLYTMQEENRYLQEHLVFLDKAKGLMDKSLHRMPERDALAFDAEVLSVRVEEKQMDKALEKSKIAFKQQLGIPSADFTLERPPLPNIPITLDKLLKKLGHFPSYQKMLALRHEQTQKKLTLIEQDRKSPLFQPMVGYGTYKNDSHDEFKVGLTLSIPLWNRRSNEAEALRADEDVLRRQVQGFDYVSFDEMVAESYDRLKTQLDLAQKCANKIVPGYAKSVEKTEEGFLNGQVSILEVWQIREKYTSAQKQCLDALRKVLEAKMELENLIGIRLEDIQGEI